MGLFNFLGVLSPAHINWIRLSRRGKFAGEDQIGNKYFAAAPRKGYKLERRWVIYKGQPEASAVPPEWHGWLHHQTDICPATAEKSYRRPWQKPHQPNMTGTNHAHRPPGHVLSGQERQKTTGDYEPWTPSE